MRDFTLNAYAQYLTLLRKKRYIFIRFDEYMTDCKDMTGARVCLLRHDVDRKPYRALKMARLEARLGVKATYYFRMKQCSFNPSIIIEIAALGHEIGYHYETLSDSNGDIKQALADFEANLNIFRKIVPVRTCSMHGRPFKPYDNRDIWRIKENNVHLKTKLNMLGEIYLDISYANIAYINDTGRNWTSSKGNYRDKVVSNIKVDFSSGTELLGYFNNNPHHQICFQVHPERWINNWGSWIVQYIKDKGINSIKFAFALLSKE